MRSIREVLIVAAVVCLAFVAVQAQAQRGTAGDVEYLLTPLGLPCEPGDVQFGFFPCPPVAAQGVLLHVRSGDPNFTAFEVTVEYDGGQTRTATFGRRMEGDQWTSQGFQIGRVKTANLPGVVVTKISIRKLAALGPPTEITIGPSTFGPPKE